MPANKMTATDKEKHVEKLTDEALDKVSGGTKGSCRPQTPKCDPQLHCEPLTPACEPKIHEMCKPNTPWCKPMDLTEPGK